MKIDKHATFWLAFVAGLLSISFQSPVFAQTTAFTYQGRLSAGTNFPTGAYDLRFTLHDSLTAGNSLSTPLTNSVSVTNGLFTVTLDFGSAFDGSARWLEISARTNGATNFTALSPRQSLTAVPYATYSPNAGTATLASGVAAGGVTSAMLADGAVTSGKIAVAAVKPANIDDGGSSSYNALMDIAKGLSTTEPLPFSDLSLIGSNNTARLSFRLEGSSFGTVLGFVGHEGISEVYEYVVEVLAPDPSLDPEAQVGHPAALIFERSGRSTAFAGMVTACSQGSHQGTGALYTFRLEPPLAFLRFSSNHRIYQQTALPNIASTLYTDITGDSLSSVLSGTHQPRECTIQYAETALNFFNRLLEQEAVFYFFRQEESPTLVLADDSFSCPSAPYDGLRYYGNFATNPRPSEECLRTFQKAGRESTKTATLNGYDFQKPRVSLLATKPASAGRGETYEYDAAATDITVLNAKAAQSADRQLVERNLASGSGNAADLRPGYTFALDDRSEAGVAGTYLVTGIRHAAFRRQTNNSIFYGNQFEVIPASVKYSPARKTPKPMAPACTAVVTGSAGQEINTDKYGRVKVQFHWDRSATSSGWIRVATQWAGKQWGTIFIPRVGQEVLVEFVGGDPDQPVITGTLYNADQMPPYTLPANATKSGIKTHSTTNGLTENANEIRFDDAKGAEQFYMKAEKDFDVSVKNNMTLSVNNDLSSSVANNFTLGVGRSLSISAAQGVGINAPPDATLALKAGGMVAASAFQGSGAGLTNLPATNLTGQISDARLSTNVALLNGNQNFVTASFQRLGAGGAAGSDALNIVGDARFNDHDLFFRGDYDYNHGLGWYGSGKLFAGLNLDGPALYGCDGGGLGTACGTQKLALRWRGNGDVAIDPNSQNTGALLPGLTFGNDSTEGISSKRTAGGANPFGLSFYTSNQLRVAIAQNGNVGIGKTNPAVLLDVAGSIRTTGAIRSGSETGTTHPPGYPAGSDGLILRRTRCTDKTTGYVVARTDKLTLERDGTIAGLRLAYPASPGRQVINCTGISTNGTQVIYRNVLTNPTTAGYLPLFSDTQKIVHYDISFGDTYASSPGHTTHVVLDRYDDGTTSDHFLVGTLTSTYNQ